ncbi:2OG-Fe(II) oxygenase [Paraglaciecola sp. 20A4]|uniref:2OG-Fe(II) oxygenase family protein n=1 Tax=Paraglaciecola sp. 20A4 TaxID=2687288 RepID=UPI00140CA6D0|nr:2OG-Fe(II) oxygenase [Paraglaciecola sp. 20A4]
MKFLGRDIAVKKNGLTDKECSQLISLFSQKNDAITLKNKDSGAYTTNSQYESIKLFLDESPVFSSFVVNKLNQILNEYCAGLDLKPETFGDFYESPSLMRFRTGKDRFDVHFDASGYDHYRSLAFIWYLNDVSEGGELFLPSSEQSISIKPEMGNIAVVPAGWTHYHNVETPISNDRYSLITFLRYSEIT